MEEVSVLLKLFIRFNHLFIQMYALNTPALPDIMQSEEKKYGLFFFFSKRNSQFGKVDEVYTLDRKVCLSSEAYNSIWQNEHWDCISAFILDQM